MSARLVTIRFSHYCDKARWALDKRGVDYVEDAHLPFFSWLHTFGRGGGRTTPVLVLPDGKGVLKDSTDIVAYADTHGTRGDKLLPNDEVAKLEDEFDIKLGPHTRRAAYFALLPHDASILQLVATAPVPAIEKLVAKNALGAMRAMLRRGLNITAESAARSETFIGEVFHGVEERLADGRRYLCGDSFTGADLTFAALAGPVLMPPAYARTLIPYEDIGPASRALCEKWRATKAGAFGMRVYEHDR